MKRVLHQQPGRSMLLLGIAVVFLTATPGVSRADLLVVPGFSLPGAPTASTQDLDAGLVPFTDLASASRAWETPSELQCAALSIPAVVPDELLPPTPLVCEETTGPGDPSTAGADELAATRAARSDEVFDPAPPDAARALLDDVEVCSTDAPSDGPPRPGTARFRLGTLLMLNSTGDTGELEAAHLRQGVPSATVVDPASVPVADSVVMLGIGDLGVLSYARWRKRSGARTRTPLTSAAQAPGKDLPRGFFVGVDSEDPATWEVPFHVIRRWDDVGYSTAPLLHETDGPAARRPAGGGWPGGAGERRCRAATQV